jgi:hypothetical protein
MMKMLILATIAGVLIMIGFSMGGEGSMSASISSQDKKLETATFAGGCFWCMEPPFEKLGGVAEVISGYTGGAEENPAYEEVSSGETGHVEAIQIVLTRAKYPTKNYLKFSGNR